MAAEYDMEDSHIETHCKTVIGEEAEGNGQHEIMEKNSDKHFVYTSDSFLYTRNETAIERSLSPRVSFLCTSTGPDYLEIALSSTEEVRELHLKKMFIMPSDHELYCPNCNICINKVILCRAKHESSITILSSKSIDLPPEPAQDINEDPTKCSTCFYKMCLMLLFQEGLQFFTAAMKQAPIESQLESGSLIQPDSIIVLTTHVQLYNSASTSKGWEILKSIAYGGMAELLASLSVLTSAASADAATSTIVALGVANLIGGLLVLGHNLKDLKSSEAREDGSEREEQVDKYYELLGNRDNFFLHVCVAILSFLIFGLVPPIVYGFSFRESNDKNLKLAAVAGASLICIILLGIVKAQTQRPNMYFKTVSFYVALGALTSLLTYVAGAVTKGFVEQFGWFEPKSNLSLPEMSVDKSWGSY